MDAEVGIGLHLLGAPEAGIDRPRGDLAEEVGLVPGRGGFFPGRPERRAHPEARLLRPAGATAVAGRGLLEQGQPGMAEGRDDDG